MRRSELAALALCGLLFLAGLEVRDVLEAARAEPECSTVPYATGARPKCVLVEAK